MEKMPVDIEKARQICKKTLKGDGTISRRTARRCVKTVLAAVERTEQRRRSDRHTSPARRRLIGANVPLDIYRRYKAQADRHGLSLYAWASEAFALYFGSMEREPW